MEIPEKLKLEYLLALDNHIETVGKENKEVTLKKIFEITRDIAKSFNHSYGDTFIIPDEAAIVSKGFGFNITATEFSTLSGLAFIKPS